MADFLTLRRAPGPLHGATLIRCVGDEAMSALHSTTLHVLCKTALVAPDGVLGEPVGFEMCSADGSAPRFFGGVIGSIEGLGQQGADRFGYHLTVMPALWLATLAEDCRIFHEMTAQDILEEVFSAYRSDFAVHLDISRSLHQREYTVQFDESDFAFAERLMAEEGLFFVHRHDENAGARIPQRVIIADHIGAYRPCVQRRVVIRADHQEGAGITDWTPIYDLHTTRHETSDYNDQTSDVQLESGAISGVTAHQAAGRSRYNIPGRHRTPAEAKDLVSIRADAEAATANRVTGKSRYTHFAPGELIRLDDAPSGVEARGLVLLRVHHELFSPPAGEATTAVAGPAGTDVGYRNAFTALPDDFAFRPPLSPRKQIPGPQTAVVVGRDGMDVDVDADGRIYVRFHWDRRAQRDKQLYCPLRVAQVWAGAQIGGQWIPRIGMEVLVDFINGDPDRPVVVGCNYHSSNKVPFPLPANKTVSGWRTITSPRDQGNTAIELKFEDKAGSEEVYFYTGRDFRRIVDNNDFLEVKNNQTEVITENRTKTVEKGDDSLTVEKGDRSIDVTMGQSTLTTATRITLKVGGSSIVMDPTSITIKTTKLLIDASAEITARTTEMKLKASASLTAKAGAMMSAESPMTTLKGNGILTLKGGLVLIN